MILTERELIAAAAQWAKDNGWTSAGWRGWQNARYEDGATIAVHPNESGFEVWRKDTDTPHFRGMSTDYPADSVRQAVDLLVALGILPAEFSTAYAAGVREYAETLKAFVPNIYLSQVGDPAAPLTAEPSSTTVVYDRDGAAWARHGDGWVCLDACGDVYTWQVLDGRWGPITAAPAAGQVVTR